MSASRGGLAGSARRLMNLKTADSFKSGHPGYKELIATLAIEEDSEFLQRALPKLEDPKLSVDSNTGQYSEKMTMIKKYGREMSTCLYLSPAHDWLCWDRNDLMSKIVHKDGMKWITISHIVRVEVGMNTTNFARRRTTASDEEIERSFSVVTHDQALNLIAESADYAKVWVRVLTLLVQKHFVEDDEAEADSSLFDRYLEEQWNRAVGVVFLALVSVSMHFEQAQIDMCTHTHKWHPHVPVLQDTDRSHTLTLKELMLLLKMMNIQVYSFNQHSRNLSSTGVNTPSTKGGHLHSSTTRPSWIGLRFRVQG